MSNRISCNVPIDVNLLFGKFPEMLTFTRFLKEVAEGFRRVCLLQKINRDIRL